MIKILAFLLIFYFLFRVAGFFFRVLTGGLGARAAYQHSQNNQSNQKSRRKTNADGVSIEYAPENKSKRSASNFKGGEYVDYEEIK